jgi:hypothetical protein
MVPPVMCKLMSYITSKGQIKLKGNSTHESFIHLFFKKKILERGDPPLYIEVLLFHPI